jgi:Uma2 family endonuclease
MSRSTLESHSVSPSHGLMSYEEFLATDFEKPHVEWVNGRAIVMSPSNEQHQGVNRFLGTLIQIFVREKQLGVVLEETFQMKTGRDLPGREPDILFVSNGRKKRLKKRTSTVTPIWRWKSSAPIAWPETAAKSTRSTKKAGCANLG